jgi:hypothetical protein
MSYRCTTSVSGQLRFTVRRVFQVPIFASVVSLVPLVTSTAVGGVDATWTRELVLLPIALFLTTISVSYRRHFTMQGSLVAVSIRVGRQQRRNQTDL